MFACTAITSTICYAIGHGIATEVTLGGILFMNLGAFLTLFAIAGFAYGLSCYFDRSKYSLAIGGGVSIFMLVATILGLFGSQVMPSIIRFNALNYFNYVSIISLFDILDITSGSLNLIWKFAILLVIGLAGFILGSLHFKKKDLPL